MNPNSREATRTAAGAGLEAGTMNNKVKVTIYGNTYNIQGDAAPEYIQKMADYVNEKMEEVGKNLQGGNIVQIAILAALNITDEYHQYKEMRTGIAGDLEQKTRALISMLDEGLIGDVFSGYEPSRGLSRSQAVR
jgi:cell division protein ZapA